ncbi:sensor histidine kinase [Granulicoccus phenolivorans]|uniref:sensor histidine kinase n=1 Tax=Granulicoccus phenolivorans TaxID=266854 RepID=UPI0005593B09|nr:histidine kinase [Granulicoccus phenolivorans]
MTRSRRELIGDAVRTAVLLVLGVGTLPFLPLWGDQTRPVDGWAYALVTLTALAAGVRARPIGSFAATVLLTSLYLWLGYPYGPMLVCLAVATYTLARQVRLRPALLTGTIALPLLLSHLLAKGPVDGVLALIPGAAWLVVPFSIGVTRRLTVEAAQRQRADAERRVLNDERVRLASEVHDIVGHGLAAIQMQADIARHVRTRKPEQADIALAAISRTSAEALAELRTTLATIAPDGITRSDALAPVPGMRRLGDLCARMRESGIEVDLSISGQRRTLAPAVDLAAYRVIQEALTNVAKHASDRSAAVRVGYGTEELTIEVVNAAASNRDLQEGFGIAGMRRRVHDVDGSITIDPSQQQFRVAVSLPA